MRRAVMAAAVCAMALTGADAFAPASPVGGRAGIVRETRALRPAALAQGAPRTCRACPPVSMAAAGTEAPWKIVKNTAARTAFVLNQWKNVAENSRSLGWTSSSEEAMMKLRREAATADAMKAVIPALMKRATLDKAIAEVGKAPEGMPDEITNLGVTLAVSVGAGSACALYYKCPEKKFWCIEQLVANTAMAGQLESQVHVIQEIAKDAKEEGVPEVRMASCCYDEMKGTIYGSLEELGFQQPEADVAWSVYKQ